MIEVISIAGSILPLTIILKAKHHSKSYLSRSKMIQAKISMDLLEIYGGPFRFKAHKMKNASEFNPNKRWDF